MKLKHTHLLTVLLLSTTIVSKGQAWTRGVTQEHPDFHDIQRAFNDYWAPFHVVNGRFMENGVEHKAPGWKQFKRWEHYWEVRTGPTGAFPDDNVDCVEWGKYAKDHLGGQGSAKVNADWTPLGPSTNTVGGIGRISCIAFHPTDANTFWVGTPAGGLWKTTNGGGDWSTNTDDLPVLGVSSIAIDPTDAQTMYIATGDGDGALSLSAFGQPLPGDTRSIGILKSIDGGQNWTSVLSAEPEEGLLIRKIVIDPVYPNYLFAVSNQGIWATEDGGDNWSQVLTGYFTDIEYHPVNTDITYASSLDPGGNAQVYISYNVGVDWVQATGLSGVNRIEIGVTPAEPDAVDILCSSAANDGMEGMYYSLNQGVDWAQYWTGGAGGNLLGYYDDASDESGQGSYDLAFAIDPANYSNIYVGGVNTWRTNDGGAGWSPASIWTDGAPYNNFGYPVVHADKHFLAFHPLLANTLFDCNDGGVWKSTDGGDSWTDLNNGITTSQMYSISNAQTVPDRIAAGLQDNGAIARDNGEWSKVTGGDGMMCAIDPSDENYIYTAYVNGVIYRTEVATQNQYTISENMPGGQQAGEWLTPYLLDPDNPSVIFAGYESLYRSDDRGDSWEQRSTPYPGVKMNYLAIARSNSDVICAGYLTGLLRSTNGGYDWTDITAGLPVDQVSISSVTIDPVDPEFILVTLSGYADGQKVYLSADGGASWGNATNTGLPNLPVNCLEIDASSGTVYLGTDVGVYVYDADITGWAPFNTGLPNVVVADLEMYYAEGKLRAGTFGRGLWETTTYNVSVGRPPVESGLSVFPVPAADLFTVRLAGPGDDLRGVDVYNAAGQVVARERASGTGRNAALTVDVSGLPSAVYQLVVHTAQGDRAQRVVVQR